MTRPALLIALSLRWLSRTQDVPRDTHALLTASPPTPTGALVYHIRRVLNDWPDKDVTNILRQISAAAAPDSRVLISEQIITEAPSQMMGAVDLFFMNFGGKRRSERHYGELAAAAGLRLSSFSRHGTSDSAVIELVVA